MIHTSKVYFVSYNPGQATLGSVTVTASPPAKATSRHNLYLKSSTLVPHGVLNFKLGDYVVVRYDSNFTLIEMHLLTKAGATPKVVPKYRAVTRAEISEIVENVMNKKEPTAVEKELAITVNMCVQSIMYVCGAKSSTRDKCKFFEESLARMNDCMYFRQSFGDVCDCVAAHIDLAKSKTAF
jgi:hypothetical protein